MESLTEEQRKEIEENESMILNSTSTIEAQAGAKGQEWTNLGRQLFAAAPGPKAEVWWDYSTWSPAPWTSGQAEPLPLMAFKAMMLGARTLQAGWNLQAPATHPTGVAVSGTVSMGPDEGVPNIPFFDQKDISVQARFSNIGVGWDDRASSIRGCVIILTAGKEEFHLHMNTGSTGIFDSLMTFGMVAMANKGVGEYLKKDNPKEKIQGGLAMYKKWLFTRASDCYNIIEMTVRGPSSYTRLHFYSKFPLLLTDSAGVQHLAKFRLVPHEDGPYEGLLTEDQQKEMWNIEADADDERPTDYLRKELHQRVQDGEPTLFRLEIMTRQKTSSDPSIFFHPSADWKEPWRALATIRMTDIMDTQQMQSITSDPHSLPEGLSVIMPTNSFDPNWINFSRSEIYKRSGQIRSIRLAAEAPYDNTEMVKYKVTVWTGEMTWAGTDSKVSIVVVGDKATTRKHYLDKMLRNDFEQGDSHSYTFKDQDVGEIEFIIVKMEEGTLELVGNSEWYLDKVQVTISARGHREETFPHFQWIHNDKDPRQESPLILTANKTRLPQHETNLRTTARLLQSQQQDAIVKWTYDWPKGNTGEMEDVRTTLPGFLLTEGISYTAMDQKFQWYEDRFAEKRVLTAELQGAVKNNIVKAMMTGQTDMKINSIEEYKDVTDAFSGPCPEDACIEDWDSDAEFGRATLNGPNPTSIKRIKKIPDNFPVTDKHVEGLLERGLSLEEEVAAGHIYMVDYKILEGIPCGKYDGNQLVVPAAMALFYHNPENDLTGLAIQLGQNPGPECPIWLANEPNKDDWRLAKFWFKCADAQVAQLVAHLGHTHFLTEPFAMAMHRCLTPSHPVHKLLKEHLKFIFAVDTIGRVLLFAPGGSVDITMAVGHGSNGLVELISKSFKDFTYEDMHYVNDLKRRDMMDLPNFHHRDDCIKLWDATLDYVITMVDTFYKSDMDVIQDWELQFWVKDVFENGFGKMEGLKAPSLGLPSRLGSKVELVDYLQRLIYTGTTRHTFINFYGFQYAKFAPIGASVMNGLPPTEEDRGKATLQTLLAALPDRKQACTQAATGRVLNHKAEDEIYLMETPSWMFQEPEATVVFGKFCDRLREIEKEMVERNKSLRVPYTVLYPSTMPAGIAI